MLENLSRDGKPWKGEGNFNVPFSGEARLKAPRRGDFIVAPGFNPGNKASPHQKSPVRTTPTKHGQTP